MLITEVVIGDGGVLECIMLKHVLSTQLAYMKKICVMCSNISV